MTELEGRLFKDESMKSTKWDDDCRSDVDEQIVKNTYLNAQMTKYADYSNMHGENHRKLFWIDENGTKTVVETVGIAASSKDSLSFMISSIRPVNRLVSQSMNAKGP